MKRSNSSDYLAEYLDRIERLYARDKYHASVILWSLGNESGFGENQKKMAQLLKSYDKDLLIHYEGAWNWEGENGEKLSVYANGDFFSFKVNDFIGEDLQTARHITDLKRGETLELAIDGYFSGVGSNSCGPELPEDRRITDKVLNFGVYFRFE